MNHIEAIKKGLDALDYVMSHGPQVQIAKDILTQAIEQSEREWVSLTDEEIVSTANTIDGFGVIKQRDMNFAKSIEAKLKEKNT